MRNGRRFRPFRIFRALSRNYTRLQDVEYINDYFGKIERNFSGEDLYRYRETTKDSRKESHSLKKEDIR